MKKKSIFKNRLVYLVLAAGIVGAGALYYAKFKRRKSSSNSISISLIEKKNYSTKIVLGKDSYDLEDVRNDKSIDASIASSGIKSTKLSPEIEYGYTISKNVKDVPSYTTLSSIQVEFKAWCKEDIASSVYVLAINGPDGKSISWDSKPITTFKKEEWGNVRLIFSVPTEGLKPENMIKLYPWNKGKKEFYLDDFVITYNANKITDASQKATLPESNFLYDFESTQGLLKTQTISTGIAHSGRYSSDLTGRQKYSPAVVKQIGEVCSEALKKISASVWVYPTEDNITLTLETFVLNGKEESLFWDGKTIDNKSPLPKNTWTKVNASFMLPYGEFSLDDFICVDVWNKGGSFYVDDLEVIYGEDADRRGSDSDLNPNDLYEHKYVSARNKAPFETFMLQKQDIGNKGSTHITKDNNVNTDLAPGDDYLVGNFCTDAALLDEVIRYNKAGASLFGSNDVGFQLLIGTTELAAYFSPDAFQERIAGNFSKAENDVVLLINKNKKAVKLIGFASKTDCINKKQTAITEEWTGDGSSFEAWSFSNDDKFYACDITGDQRSELLIVNSANGNWAAYSFDSKKWSLLASGKDGNAFDPGFFKKDKSVFVSGRFVGNQSKMNIIASKTGSKGDVHECFMLRYDASKKTFVQQAFLPENTANLFFAPKSNCYAINMDADPEDEIICLNTDWRFELRLINIDDKGPVITRTIDFAGYEADQNPKYYEFVKIAAGNFYAKENASFLVMMRNCSDNNFDGVTCKEYENLKALPNRTLLFSATNQ